MTQPAGTRFGLPTAAAAAGGLARRCTVPSCDRVHKAHGYCRTHYRRWQRHGDPLADVPVSGSGSSYRTALAQVRAVRGGPEVQACAECGGPATVWSYDSLCPQERAEPGRGRRYSLDPARYRPRCRFCHRRAVVDRAEPVAPLPRVAGPAMDVDRAVRLYMAGATASGIAGLLRVSPDVVLRALRAREVPIRPARGRHSSRIR